MTACYKKRLCSVTQNIKSHPTCIFPKTTFGSIWGTFGNQAMPIHDFVTRRDFFLFKPPLLRLGEEPVLNLKIE